MVKAITEGRKTQTRRVLTKINTFGNVTEVKKHNSLWHMFDKKGQTHKLTDEEMVIDCHFGQPGDRLSVREPWQYALPGHPAKTKNKFVYVAKAMKNRFG